MIKLQSKPSLTKEPITLCTFVNRQPSTIMILNPNDVLQVTKLPSDPRSMQRNERPMRSSGKPSEKLQSSESENQDRRLAMESGKHSSDGSLQSNGMEGQ